MFKTLIIEDSSFFRQLFKEMLHSQFPSMEIFETSDGEEALNLVGTLLPDLVFMDIKLPGGNGLDLTKTIKTKYPDIIVIILSAYDLSEYREAAYQHGASYFLSKGASSKEEILSPQHEIRSLHLSPAIQSQRISQCSRLLYLYSPLHLFGAGACEWECLRGFPPGLSILRPGGHRTGRLGIWTQPLDAFLCPG